MMVFLFAWGNNLQGQVLVNPKVGYVVGFSDFTYQGQKWETKSSFRLGADVRIGRQAFRLIPGVHYGLDRFGVPQISGTFEGHTVHTIQIPVYAAYYLTSRENPTNLLVRLGLNGNLYLGQAEFDPPTVEPLESEPFTLSAGGGLTLDLAIISIDLTYLQDFSPRFDLSEKKGQVLQLGLGIIF